MIIHYSRVEPVNVIMHISSEQVAMLIELFTLAWWYYVVPLSYTHSNCANDLDSPMANGGHVWDIKCGNYQFCCFGLVHTSWSVLFHCVHLLAAALQAWVWFNFWTEPETVVRSRCQVLSPARGSAPLKEREGGGFDFWSLSASLSAQLLNTTNAWSEHFQCNLHEFWFIDPIGISNYGIRRWCVWLLQLSVKFFFWLKAKSCIELPLQERPSGSMRGNKRQYE